MKKQAFIIFLLMLCALWGASCVRNKNPLSLKDDNGDNRPTDFVTCPQTDIPWPSLADSPWPMSTVNPQGIARSSYKGPKEGNVLWAIALENVSNKTTQGGPAIAPDGTIYIGENGGDFFAISPGGQIKWRMPARIYTGPVVAADSTIYVGGVGFYALRPNGTVKWMFDGSFLGIRPLLGIDGTIYTKDGYGNIYAITPDGNMKWQNAMGQDGGISYMSASPDGSTIYAPGRDTTLIALNAASGAIQWTVKTGLPFYAGPTVDRQGNIYFPGAESDSENDRYVYSLNPSGELRWKFKVDNAWDVPYAGINIDKDGHIYFGWNNRGIFVLDYAGQLCWKFKPEEGYTDSPIICDAESKLYILNVGSPRVWCYLPDGTLKFSVEIPNMACSQLFPGAIGKNGIMYFGGNSEWIVALK